MNSDDLMSDPAVPTPSDSTKGAATPVWNSKKFREEYELYKRRLQHQKFSVGKFGVWAICTIPVAMSKRPSCRVVRGAMVSKLPGSNTGK